MRSFKNEVENDDGGCWRFINSQNMRHCTEVLNDGFHLKKTLSDISHVAYFQALWFNMSL